MWRSLADCKRPRALNSMPKRRARVFDELINPMNIRVRKDDGRTNHNADAEARRGECRARLRFLSDDGGGKRPPNKTSARIRSHAQKLHTLMNAENLKFAYFCVIHARRPSIREKALCLMSSAQTLRARARLFGRRSLALQFSHARENCFLLAKAAASIAVR